MENFALNLLILLSTVPLEYQAETIERREKRKENASFLPYSKRNG
jgi:hypothetical protein